MLSDGVIRRLKQINDRALMDRCVWLKFVPGAVDGYGLDKPESFQEWGDELECLFRKGKPGEAMEQAEVATATGQLRLAKGTGIEARDRIRLTQLHGEDLAEPQTYKIVGEPRETYVGLVLNLELITDGS